MALPWLIGAAVVGLGSLIAAAASDDSSSNSSSGTGSDSSADEERRRREAAAKEHRRREREEKLASARTLFAGKGAALGEELGEALDGIVQVKSGSTPAFRPRLGAQDLGIPSSDDGRAHEVSHALRGSVIADDPELERIVENLEFHARVYDVNMCCTPRVWQKLLSLDDVNAALVELDSIERQLRALRRGAAA